MILEDGCQNNLVGRKKSPKNELKYILKINEEKIVNNLKDNPGKLLNVMK
jgi:hypothetical protein